MPVDANAYVRNDAVCEKLQQTFVRICMRYLITLF
jgi:hypothetical protein